MSKNTGDPHEVLIGKLQVAIVVEPSISVAKILIKEEADENSNPSWFHGMKPRWELLEDFIRGFDPEDGTSSGYCWIVYEDEVCNAMFTYVNEICSFFNGREQMDIEQITHVLEIDEPSHPKYDKPKPAFQPPSRGM